MKCQGLSTFSISFQDSEIKNHHTRTSYDILSLIGEIDGVLGLTLGLSFFSFVGSCISVFKFINNMLSKAFETFPDAQSSAT